MKSNFYKDFKTALIISVIICITIIILNYALGARLTANRLLTTTMINFYYAIPISLVNGWLFEYQNRVIPWEKEPKKRAIYGFLGMFFATMAVLMVLNFILWTLIQGNEISVLWLKENRTFYLVAVLITLIVTLTLHALTFFKEIQSEKLMNAQLRQEKLQTELSALRSQVDPHFLFNSFNVLSGLIDEDQEKAQDFLSGLSKIYRYILEQKDEVTRTVEDELKFAMQYLKLQQMRFENSIQIVTDLEPIVLKKHIPSLSLQILLENAVKHNGFDDNNPLVIEIKGKKEYLVIRNNRKLRKNLAPSNGMGLQNIKDRYGLLTDKSPIIEADAEMFTVKIPLI